MPFGGAFERGQMIRKKLAAQPHGPMSGGYA
jgi:hypothetical protein